MRIILILSIFFAVSVFSQSEKLLDNRVSQLIKNLSDNSWIVRLKSAKALGTIGPQAKDAIPYLIKALSNKDKYVKSSAAYALGEIGSQAKEAVPNLIKALSDKYNYVRKSAIAALGKIDPSWKTKKYPKELQEIVDKYLKETNKK